jgi:superfamily II DNA or RNA helicase
VLPCGGGKTVVFSEIIRLTIAKSIAGAALVLAHRRELVFQAARKLKDAGVDRGIIMRGYPYEPLLRVHVASVSTLHRRGIVDERIDMPRATIIIVDEAHHVAAPTWKAILDAYPDAIVLGFTATPERADGRGLGGVFKAMVVGPSTQELIDLGFLVPTKGHVYVPVSISTDGVETGADGDWKPEQLEKRVMPIIGEIGINKLKFAAGKQAILYFPGVDAALAEAEELTRLGEPTKCVHGDTPPKERDEILAAFERREITNITNCGVFTEGFDPPACECIVLARPTKNFGLYLQMVGRGLRPSPQTGKKFCIVIDHGDCTRRHGYAEDPVTWTLDPDKRAATKRKERRRKEAADRIAECPGCGELYSPPQCSKCGFKPERRGKALDVIAGELGLLQEDGSVEAKKRTRAEWMDVYLQMLGWCREHGKDPGTAFHALKKMSGGFEAPWPWRNLSPKAPSPEIAAIIRKQMQDYARRKSYAKSSERELATGSGTAPPSGSTVPKEERMVTAAKAGRACGCGSQFWKVEPPKGPHAAGLRCAACGRHGGWLPKGRAAA